MRRRRPGLPGRRVLALRAPAAQEWTTHGGDLGESRFSPLTQITPANVGRLEPAWSFDAGASNLQFTPLVVGGQMYLTAGSNVFALEPESGRQIWRFEAPGVVSRRGVAYWPGDAKTPPRLFTGAGDRLIALDARSGRLVARVRHPRPGRAEPRHHRRRRGPHQPGVAADRLQGPAHHRRQQRRAGAEPRPLRRHPRLGRPHRGAEVDLPHGAAGRRARRRDVGRRQLEEPIRHQHVVVLHHRRRARPRSTCRSDRRPPTTTAAIARARTSTATRSSRSTWPPAR